MTRSSSPAFAERPNIRPNIIFIVADDLGYADLGCYGGRDAAFGKVSPVLDELAANGMKFINGYANSPVCSPTRFALMTARYQYHLRGAAEEPINSKSRGSLTLGLPPEHPTLPSLLKDAGYRTALIGKWHLGYPPAFGPIKSGYEEFIGPMSGGVDYFTHCNWAGEHDFYIDEAEKHVEGYLTDLISNRSVDYVNRMAATQKQGQRQGQEHGAEHQPFFLSMHYTAPHWPWETRDDKALAVEVKNNLFHLHGGNIETYQRMIHHMDEGIGQVVETLKAHDMLDNTLIVFTSDNGGERFSDNWPLVGGKMDLTEGGIRVPYIAHWPAGIKVTEKTTDNVVHNAACAISTQHCLTMDWSATMLSLGGAKAHSDYPLDGVDLSGVLRDGETFGRTLFWRMNHREQQAYRLNEYKYLRVDQYEYLFNIESDPRERANLAHIMPDKLAEMRAQWQAWNATMPPIPNDATVSLGYGLADMPQR